MLRMGFYQLQGKIILTQRLTVSNDITSGKYSFISEPHVKIMFLPCDFSDEFSRLNFHNTENSDLSRYMALNWYRNFTVQ